MDAIGFAFATAVLATVFTVFGVIDRLLVGLVSEIRYTITPAIANGMRAWGNGSAGLRRVASSDVDDPGPGAANVTRGRSAEPRSSAMTVTVQPVTSRTWLRFTRLPHAPVGVAR